LIRLTSMGLTVLATPDELRSARDAWDRVHHFTVPDLLDPPLYAMIARALEQTPFVDRTHKGIGTELCAGGSRALDVLQFLANDPRLFAMVGELTGAGPIRSFEGRVYRHVPGTEHHDSWHDDVSGTRLVALSINLGAEPYQGGVLQIRERASGCVVAEVENTRPGGGVLFRIAEHLQHRITPVTGGVAKTAYAGWFRERPDFRDVVAGRARF
jgi:hypothetical protein